MHGRRNRDSDTDGHERERQSLTERGDRQKKTQRKYRWTETDKQRDRHTDK